MHLQWETWTNRMFHLLRTGDYEWLCRLLNLGSSRCNLPCAFMVAPHVYCLCSCISVFHWPSSKGLHRSSSLTSLACGLYLIRCPLYFNQIHFLYVLTGLNNFSTVCQFPYKTLLPNDRSWEPGCRYQPSHSFEYFIDALCYRLGHWSRVSEASLTLFFLLNFFVGLLTSNNFGCWRPFVCRKYERVLRASWAGKLPVKLVLLSSIK